MHVVGMEEIFQYAPKETHVQDVKRIFRYLKGTLEFGLWYTRNDTLSFIAYSDSN